MSSIMDDVRAAAAESAPATVETTVEATPAEGVSARPVDAPPEAPARVRDEGGRFAAAQKVVQGEAAAEKNKTTAAEETSTVPEAEKQTPTGVERKPPASLRAVARELWPQVPPAIQDEFLRLNGEVTRTMQAAAQSKRTAEAFNRVVEPYRGLIGQGDPVQVVGNLFQTAQVLHTGTPQAKADMVATIVSAYNVPIEALDRALTQGQNRPAQPQRPQEYRDPRLDVLLERHAAAEQQRYQREVEDFEKTAEFLNEPMGRHDRSGRELRVRDVMANFIQAAEQAGDHLSLQDAYDMVISKHHAVQRVLAERKPPPPAATASPAATQRARAAASSVKNEPTGTMAPTRGDSVMDYVKESAALLRGR